MTANPFASALSKEQRDREHDVTISTRYGETTRECYCRATRGRAHAEWDFPWLTWDEAQSEEPLDLPFNAGENVDDYIDRKARFEAWRQGYQYGLDHARDTEDEANPRYSDDEWRDLNNPHRSRP